VRVRAWVESKVVLDWREGRLRVMREPVHVDMMRVEGSRRAIERMSEQETGIVLRRVI